MPYRHAGPNRCCRQLSTLTSGLPKNSLPSASFRNVAPFDKGLDPAAPALFI